MSNSSVFNVRAKVLKSLQDLQLNEREFQAAEKHTYIHISINQCNAMVFGTIHNTDILENNVCRNLSTLKV